MLSITPRHSTTSLAMIAGLLVFSQAALGIVAPGDRAARISPRPLGEAIAAAFLATLWGLLSANLLYLPIAGKLKAKSEEEARNRYMQLEGIISIQAGENPRVVRDKLSAYLSPSEVKSEKAAEGAGKKAPAANAGKAQA